MPITASQMALNVAETTVTYQGEDVKVVFYPDRITSKAIAQLDGSVGDFDATLADLIQSWDVLEDDGSMFPLEPARLATLSFPFRVQVARAVMRAIRPEALEA